MIRTILVLGFILSQSSNACSFCRTKGTSGGAPVQNNLPSANSGGGSGGRIIAAKPSPSAAADPGFFNNMKFTEYDAAPVSNPIRVVPASQVYQESQE